jgi:hypothetical protein
LEFHLFARSSISSDQPQSTSLDDRAWPLIDYTSTSTSYNSRHTTHSLISNAEGVILLKFDAYQPWRASRNLTNRDVVFQVPTDPNPIVFHDFRFRLKTTTLWSIGRLSTSTSPSTAFYYLWSVLLYISGELNYSCFAAKQVLTTKTQDRDIPRCDYYPLSRI